MSLAGEVSVVPLANKVGYPALAVGLLGLVGCGAVAVRWPNQFYPAYLVGFEFWLGMGLGSLGLTMLHHLVGGQWGLPIRRPMEAGMMTLPLMALFFLPIALLGMDDLYRWMPAVLHHQNSEELVRKAVYLNPTGYRYRALGYFVIWTVLALILRSLSVRQDSREEQGPTRILQGLSGPGVILLFLSGTFASIDWMMSMEPDWTSTMYGVIVLIGMALGTFAFMIGVGSYLGNAGPMRPVVTPDRLNDLGNLLLAFVLLWAYTSFSQFLIIWSGDLTEEIPWYLRRSGGGLQFVVILLVVFHFFAPFGVLLFRESKRRKEVLLWLAAAVLVMHLVDLNWLILPATNDPAAPVFPWRKLAIVPLPMIGIGGVWIWVFTLMLKARPLVPLNDPATLAAEGH